MARARARMSAALHSRISACQTADDTLDSCTGAGRPRPMKIIVLTHVEKEGAATFDAVVPQVEGALREKGHDVSILAVYSDIHKLVKGLTEPRPDLVFNLMEMFNDDN